MKEFPLVKVVWRDAHGTSTVAYAEYEIPHAPIKITTIGWMIRSDEKGISLCNEMCEDNTFRGVTFIPAELLESQDPLIPPKKKRSAPRRDPAPSGVPAQTPEC